MFCVHLCTCIIPFKLYRQPALIGICASLATCLCYIMCISEANKYSQSDTQRLGVEIKKKEIRNKENHSGKI